MSRLAWTVGVVVVASAAGAASFLAVGHAVSSPAPLGKTSLAARSSGSPATPSHQRRPRPSIVMTSAPLAPNGTFLAADGKTTTIAAARMGKPTLVWFIDGGCASCAASIPAVAAHFSQLRADGVQVLSLGLAGDFAKGTKGLRELETFAHDAGGAKVSQPGWHWGLASLSLSEAYDPTGTPDVYVLVGPKGHVRYRGSVPVSTMPALLRAAAALRTGTTSAS
jgi:hypothetical protein